jgi:hypothetical protein
MKSSPCFSLLTNEFENLKITSAALSSCFSVNYAKYFHMNGILNFNSVFKEDKMMRGLS